MRCIADVGAQVANVWIGHVAECQERLLTGVEQDNRKAVCRERLLWVSWSRWSEKVPHSPAADSNRPIRAVHDGQLTGCPIYCPSQGDRGGLLRAHNCPWPASGADIHFQSKLSEAVIR